MKVVTNNTTKVDKTITCYCNCKTKPIPPRGKLYRFSFFNSTIKDGKVQSRCYPGYNEVLQISRLI